MDLGDDRRAQAMQIGAVLLFGVLVLAFINYQVEHVPDQNREVEFNHFKDVQDDMEVLRNAVIQAGQMGSTVPAGIDLGTTYPGRLFAVQPPGAFGSLRTRSIGAGNNPYELNTSEDMSNICNQPTPDTRFTIYQPTYTYFQSVENITYENTVVYTNGNQGGPSFQTDQQIIENDVIHVYPLVGSHSDGGMDRSTITFRGGTTENWSVEGPFTLTVPTRLSADTWDELLSDQSQVVRVGSVSGRRAVNVTFAGDETYEVRCSPTGAGRAPNNTFTGGGVLDRTGSLVTNPIGTIGGNDSETLDLNLENAQALGNTGDIDGDGSTEVPYIDETGDLRINDSTGETQTLVDASEVSTDARPDTNKTLVATDSWLGSDTSVFYANEDHDEIYRVEPGESPTRVQDENGNDVDVASNGVNSVAGTADIDGDGVDELVYTDSSQTIRYIEPDGTVRTTGQGVGSSTGIGNGNAFIDTDGDGTEEVIIVDGSNDVRLVEAGGTVHDPPLAQSEVNAAKSPVTADDVDDDGNLEIVYTDDDTVNDNDQGNLYYIDNVTTDDPDVRKLVDDDGNAAEVSTGTGVVSSTAPPDFAHHNGVRPFEGGDLMEMRAHTPVFP